VRSQPIVSFADLPECPTGSLSHVESLVVGGGDEAREEVGECLVVRAFVVDGADRDKDERRPFDELFRSERPLGCLR